MKGKKNHRSLLLSATAAVCLLVGCDPKDSPPVPPKEHEILMVQLVGSDPNGKSPVPIKEGEILMVQWTDGAGQSHGMSRLDSPQTVPSGTGNWNMDLYGRLFSTHLEIVYKQVCGVGPEIIPIHRLDSVQFGTGGRTFPKPAEAE